MGCERRDGWWLVLVLVLVGSLAAWLGVACSMALDGEQQSEA
jgi:hypothetical protein